MSQKPKIQYVGQFYIHGSEARQLEQPKKRGKHKLPLERLRKMEAVNLDVVAIAGIVVSVVMLAAMVLSLLQIQKDWEQYRIMSDYVSYLNSENAELMTQFREQYDIEDIRLKASAIGLVPKAELETDSVLVTVPQPEPEMSWLEEIKWFVKGLFA